jgi:hypothetical protein
MERVAHASAHQRACLRRCAHARRRHCAGPRGLEELWLASPAPPAACSAAPGVRRGRLCCRGQQRHRTPTPGGSGTTAAAGRGARPPAAAACRRRWWRACAALSRFMSRSLGDLGLIEVGEAVPAATSGVRAFCWVRYAPSSWRTSPLLSFSAMSTASDTSSRWVDESGSGCCRTAGAIARIAHGHGHMEDRRCMSGWSSPATAAAWLVT